MPLYGHFRTFASLSGHKNEALWQSSLLELARSLDRMSVSAGRSYPMPYLLIFLSEQYLREQYFIKILDIDI